MKLCTLRHLFVICYQVQHCIGANIPVPGGKYFVGRSKHVIPFYNANDPVWPHNISTDFLATVYYPTLQAPESSNPYMDPVSASLFEVAYNLSTGGLANLTSTIQYDAPIAPCQEGSSSPDKLFPAVVFSSGGAGPPTECYAIMISELVSRGYVVAALDHVYEQPFVRYPNGTGYLGQDPLWDPPLDVYLAIYEARVKDTVHFVQHAWPELVKELQAPWATTGLGTLGHSLGGGVSAGAALEVPEDVVTAVLNLDGSYWGRTNSSDSDLDRPVLMLAFEGHGPSTDLTWGAFIPAQTSWWRVIEVAGARHLDFSDATFWKTIGGKPLGSIDGLRMVQVYNEFIAAFFNMTLLGKEEDILNYIGPAWPEVHISAASNGTTTNVL